MSPKAIKRKRQDEDSDDIDGGRPSKRVATSATPSPTGNRCATTAVPVNAAGPDTAAMKDAQPDGPTATAIVDIKSDAVENEKARCAKTSLLEQFPAVPECVKTLERSLAAPQSDMQTFLKTLASELTSALIRDVMVTRAVQLRRHTAASTPSASASRDSAALARTLAAHETGQQQLSGTRQSPAHAAAQSASPAAASRAVPTLEEVSPAVGPVGVPEARPRSPASGTTRSTDELRNAMPIPLAYKSSSAGKKRSAQHQRGKQRRQVDVAVDDVLEISDVVAGPTRRRTKRLPRRRKDPGSFHATAMQPLRVETSLVLQIPMADGISSGSGHSEYVPSNQAESERQATDEEETDDDVLMITDQPVMGAARMPHSSSNRDDSLHIAPERLFSPAQSERRAQDDQTWWHMSPRSMPHDSTNMAAERANDETALRTYVATIAKSCLDDGWNRERLRNAHNGESTSAKYVAFEAANLSLSLMEKARHMRDCRLSWDPEVLRDLMTRPLLKWCKVDLSSGGEFTGCELCGRFCSATHKVVLSGKRRDGATFWPCATPVSVRSSVQLDKGTFAASVSVDSKVGDSESDDEIEEGDSEIYVDENCLRKCVVFHKLAHMTYGITREMRVRIDAEIAKGGMHVQVDQCCDSNSSSCIAAVTHGATEKILDATVSDRFITRCVSTIRKCLRAGDVYFVTGGARRPVDCWLEDGVEIMGGVDVDSDEGLDSSGIYDKVLPLEDDEIVGDVLELVNETQYNS